LYNFTTLGATGRNGPDNNAGYTGTGLQNIQVKDGKQKWIVPFGNHGTSSRVCLEEDLGFVNNSFSIKNLQIVHKVILN